MRIHFFEEFPDKTTAGRIAAIPFPSFVYVGAHSLAEFSAIAEELAQANPQVEIGYWPVLPKSYWLSAFSDTSELTQLRDDLRSYSGDKPLTVLLDLELPLLKMQLFVLNFFHMERNKKVIGEIFESARTHPLRFSTAEYPWTTGNFSFLARILGISFSPKRYRHKKISMCYSSMKQGFGPFATLILALVRRGIRKASRTYPHGSFAVGLGVIYHGVFGSEPILSPKEFEEDLAFCKQVGVEEVVVFRLHGFEEEYKEIAIQYAS